MNSFEVNIAKRYLFSKKGYNAINIVSGVSAVAIAVVTAAMVCVLSVMNGFGTVIESMFSRFDPDIRIVATQGKYFSSEKEEIKAIEHIQGVQLCSPVVEETALVEVSGKQIPACLKGVDENYQDLTEIDSIIVEGTYSVYDGQFNRSVIGVGLANQFGIGSYRAEGLHLYAPKRNKRVNLMRPDESLEQDVCFIAGIFAVNQVKYDDQMMLVSIDMARQLFDYTDDEVTSLEIKLEESANVKSVKRAIKQLLGDGYQVQDRYEQQADFFRILRIEKFLTTLLLAFILLIASFNIIGSLTMLILDKSKDIDILHSMGADEAITRRIFLFEGWMISSLGAIIGMFIGLILCLLQENFGLIKLGDGSEYVLSAYPISVNPTDLLLVLAIVIGLGFVAAWIPTRRLENK